MPKPKKTMKLTPGKKRQFESALNDLQAHYGSVASVWGQLTPEQRQAVLDGSPVLRSYLAFFGQFGGGYGA